jgi:hypothetical protein
MSVGASESTSVAAGAADLCVRDVKALREEFELVVGAGGLASFIAENSIFLP